MARQYGVQKVRLDHVLRVLAAIEPVGYSNLVAELANHFSCASRTAQDALSILRRAHFVETRRARAERAAGRVSWTASPPLIDTSRRFYVVSERGHYLLNHPGATATPGRPQALHDLPLAKGSPIPAGSDQTPRRARRGTRPL